MMMCMSEILDKLVTLLKFTRIHHSLFALPFLFLGVLEYTSNPDILVLLYTIIAFIGIRCFAIVYSDIIDLDYDRRNPRAANRPLVTGEVSISEAWIISILLLIMYLTGIYFIDHVVYYLWWIPIALILVYPFLKKFIPISHFILGTILAIAPWGGYIVYSKTIELGPWDLALGLLFWVAGFDIIYHIQDIKVSRKLNIKTVPSVVGPYNSLRISGTLYIVSILLLLSNWFRMRLGFIYPIGIVAVGYIYVQQFKILRRGLNSENIRKSFDLNLLVGPILLAFLLLDLLI